MIVYAISNEKGGQAKTTTTAALSEGVARRGYRVLAIDGQKLIETPEFSFPSSPPVLPL